MAAPSSTMLIQSGVTNASLVNGPEFTAQLSAPPNTNTQHVRHHLPTVQDIRQSSVSLLLRRLGCWFGLRQCIGFSCPDAPAQPNEREHHNDHDRQRHGLAPSRQGSLTEWQCIWNFIQPRGIGDQQPYVQIPPLSMVLNHPEPPCHTNNPV